MTPTRTLKRPGRSHPNRLRYGMAKRRPPVATPRDAETNAAALDRVLASQTFGQVERLKRFLEFISRETIEGRGDRLISFA